ncbi:MAG: tetratricopeptide repeat protein, partial [Nitrospinae bacterium]|nr:tetratricopeptide repeat protein [Nitrospinota bacterium]
MTGIFSRLALIALVLFGALFLPGKSYSVNNPKSPSIEDQLSRIAAGPANQIDLVETLLLISRHWDPTIDPEFLRGKLISLTASVKERMADDPSPKKVVDILKQIIHKDYGYGYTNFVDPAGIPLDASELFIHGLLNKKRGYCMNLSLLYLVLGEKLELPLYGVALPNHFFVRYDSPDHRVNIETTQGGISLPDSYYYKRFNLSQSPPPSFFMQNLGRKESLGAYFSNVGMVYYKNSKTDRAVFYLKLAAKINKLSLEAHNNLGNIYSELKQLDKAIRQYQMALEADPKSMETHFNMGIAYMDKGETPKAVESFKKVLRINPVFSPAHEILANHFMARKNYDQALTHLEKLVEIDTRNIKAREWLAEAFYR